MGDMELGRRGRRRRLEKKRADGRTRERSRRCNEERNHGGRAGLLQGGTKVAVVCALHEVRWECGWQAPGRPMAAPAVRGMHRGLLSLMHSVDVRVNRESYEDATDEQHAQADMGESKKRGMLH